jgi:hypothetical protein
MIVFKGSNPLMEFLKILAAILGGMLVETRAFATLHYYHFVLHV